MSRRNPRHALVLGGSGAVGSAIVRALRAENVPCTFTYLRGEDRARTLSSTGAKAVRLDLTDRAAVRKTLTALEDEGAVLDVLVFAAGIAHSKTTAALTDAEWDETLALHTTAPFVACQTVLPRMVARGTGDVLFLSALDRSQSLPLPVSFATSQSALGALAMALSKEHSRHGIRINTLVSGVLESGLAGSIDPRLREDYKNFSALRRAGTPDELARVARWLVLENTFMTGRALTANGGI